MSDLAVEVGLGLARNVRVLAAGVGNIGLSDDGFGAEVVQRLRSTRT